MDSATLESVYEGEKILGGAQVDVANRCLGPGEVEVAELTIQVLDGGDIRVDSCLLLQRLDLVSNQQCVVSLDQVTDGAARAARGRHRQVAPRQQAALLGLGLEPRAVG